jgi:hypothetical protein
MSHNKYITLQDSATLRTKRFRALWEGFEPLIEKTATMNKTVGGGLDVAMGGIYESYRMIVRTRHTESDNNYGSLADLEWFYRLNDPNPTSGSPSNVITMTDHFGTQKSIFFIGTFPKKTMGIEIEGSEAWYALPVMFQVIT